MSPPPAQESPQELDDEGWGGFQAAAAPQNKGPGVLKGF